MSEIVASGAALGRDGRYRCISCDAVVTPGSDHCLICHTHLGWPGGTAGNSSGAPVASLPREIDRAECSRGHGLLVHAELGGAHVHSCSPCGGVFIENGSAAVAFQGGPATQALFELAGALEESRVHEVDGSRVSYLPCPACGASMARKNFERASGVMVDNCPKHGTWYDGGEVGRAIAFLNDGGLERKERFEAREAESVRREREKIQTIVKNTRVRIRGIKL